MLIYSRKPVTGFVIWEEVRALRSERIHIPQARAAYSRMDSPGYGPISYLIMDSLRCCGPYILGIGHASNRRHHACELARLLYNPAKVALTCSLILAIVDPCSVHYACRNSPHAGESFSACLTSYQSCKQFPIIHIFHLNNNLFVSSHFVTQRSMDDLNFLLISFFSAKTQTIPGERAINKHLRHI